MDPLDDVFVELTPPPGGVSRLRARLDRRRRRWPVFTAAVAVAVVLIAVLLPTSSPELSALMIASGERPAVSVPPSAARQLAVSPVETGTPTLVLYRLDSLMDLEAR